MALRIVETLQRRLQELGYYAGQIDDDAGPLTAQAVTDFKSNNGLYARPYVGPKTLKLMVSEAAKSAPVDQAVRPVSVTATETMPPWMAEMHRKMGLHERRNTGVLSKWLKIGKYLGNPKDLPWCGDAVESCLVKTLPGEKVPDNPFWAQAWKDFGVDAGGPIVGSIGVIRWSSRAGHVGLVAGYDQKRKRVHLLGGNQSNEINITSFPRSKFIAFRWPKGHPMKRYPALKAQSVASGSHSGTR